MQMRIGSSSAVVRTACKPPRVSNVGVRRVQSVQRRDVRVAFFNFGNKNASQEAYSAQAVSSYCCQGWD